MEELAMTILGLTEEMYSEIDWYLERVGVDAPVEHLLTVFSIAKSLDGLVNSVKPIVKGC